VLILLGNVLIFIVYVYKVPERIRTQMGRLWRWLGTKKKRKPPVSEMELREKNDEERITSYN